jgi:hypothetical protein
VNRGSSYFEKSQKKYLSVPFKGLDKKKTRPKTTLCDGNPNVMSDVFTGQRSGDATGHSLISGQQRLYTTTTRKTVQSEESHT